jgi:hypothetical protein
MSANSNIRVLNVSAYKDDGYWNWNYWNTVAEITKEQFLALKSDRQTIKFVRDELGLLSEHSKGKIAVDDDGYNVTIVQKSNNMPIFALEYGRVLG